MTLTHDPSQELSNCSNAVFIPNSLQFHLVLQYFALYQQVKSPLFYFMSAEKSISKWKECFNESSLFSTEVSSHSRLLKEPSASSKTMFRISSKFTDEPKVYLKKVKDRKKEADDLHQAALKTNVKMRASLEKTEKDASVCRYIFLKLYHNKKFRLVEKDMMTDLKHDNERSFRMSVEKFRQKRWEDEAQTNQRKEGKHRFMEEFRQTKRYNEKKFRQTFRQSELRLYGGKLNSHQKVKQERKSFDDHKRNLMELAETKSKFNYMYKVNEEMNKIKECQDKLRYIGIDECNPEGQQESRGLPRVFATSFSQNMY